jgi:hypothetical protein
MAVMQTEKDVRQRVQRTQQLRERLHLAAVRLADAQQERIWAIASAHRQGLSIRQIATATGLSAARVHQLLHEAEAAAIPAWLSQVREQDAPSAPPNPSHSCSSALAAEVSALRQCIGWLEQAERGEMVVVNLRPPTEAETEHVLFDQARIRQVLVRIAADLDALARGDWALLPARAVEAEDPRSRQRRRLAEPDPPPRRLNAHEERAALRAEAGLPPE